MQMSDFARDIYKQKYAMEVPDDSSPGKAAKEEWPDTARRVTHHVLGALPPR